MANFSNFDLLGINSIYFLPINMNLASNVKKYHVLDSHIQRNSRVPDNSMNIPGLMEFQNSALKTKFKDKKQVRIIPYTLKLAKNKPLPEKVQISRISRKTNSIDELILT